MLAAAYLRVSGQGQTDGDGFPRQADTVERFAATHNHTIINTFFEDFTGTAEDRPAFNAMLDWCATTGVSVVLVENMERLSRKFSTGELLIAMCQARHITVYECTSGDELTDDDPNPDVWLRGAFKMMMAEYDRRKIQHRTRTAREKIRAAGKKCEGRKGYADTPGWEHVIEKARKYRDEGCTYAQIAARLNFQQIPTMGGREWQTGTVHQMLNSVAMNQ